jgi:hypothetical protein
MKLRAFVLIALAILLLPCASSGTPAESCEPSFVPIPMHRGLPHSYVDQGLASIPSLHPTHVLLLQRRNSRLGDVTYSLLVYKPASADETVTIEGVAVGDGKAWRFTATCSSNTAMPGLVATLEGIAALARPVR